jgi:hypothetical protein
LESIRTPFTELVGVEHPVVCAGMGGGHTGESSSDTFPRPVAAWPRDDQDLAAIFARAHDRGIG